MASLSVGAEFRTTIDRISNAGNAVIEGDDGNELALLKSDNWDEGDEVRVKITEQNGTTYTAVRRSHEGGAGAPLLHHDGTSVGKTRRMDRAFESIEEREFDPETHGAPELGEDYTPPETSSGSRSEGKSLAEIAREKDLSECTEFDS
jgi:hypothetical protein